MINADRVDSYALESPPCETCALAAHCRVQLVACAAFESFCNYGGRRWRSEAREPSRRIYDKLFAESVAA